MFWTLQHNNVLKIVEEKGIYAPDFTKARITSGFDGAYSFVLNAFNMLNPQLPQKALGLVFCFDNSQEIPLRSIEEVRDFLETGNRVNFIQKAGVNAGTLKRGNYSLLCLDGYSKDIYTLPLDIAWFVSISEYLNPDGRMRSSYSPIGCCLKAMLTCWNQNNLFYGWKNPSTVFGQLFPPSNIMQYHLPFICEDNIVGRYSF